MVNDAGNRSWVLEKKYRQIGVMIRLLREMYGSD